MTLRFVRFGWWVNIRTNLVIGSPSNLLMICRLSDYQLYHYETSHFFCIVELLELLESIHFCFHLGGDVGMNPFAENSHPNVAPVSLDLTEDRRVGRWLGWYRRVPWNSDKLGRTNADLRHVAFRYVYIYIQKWLAHIHAAWANNSLNGLVWKLQFQKRSLLIIGGWTQLNQHHVLPNDIPLILSFPMRSCHCCQTFWRKMKTTVAPSLHNQDSQRFMWP